MFWKPDGTWTPLKNCLTRQGVWKTYYINRSHEIAVGPRAPTEWAYETLPQTIELDVRGVGRFQRYPQVGDTIFSGSEGFGEVIADVGESESLVVFRTGELKDVFHEELDLVHHNLSGKGKPDHDHLISNATIEVRSVEEAEFRLALSQREAFERGLRLPADFELSRELLCDFHGWLFPWLSWGGRLRVTGEEIVVGRRNWSTPRPEELEVHLSRFLDIYELESRKISSAGKMNEVARRSLVRIYFELCLVHPFWDGNGRTSRFLLALTWLRSGIKGTLNIRGIRRFSNRNDRAFEKARISGGDLRSLEKLFARAWEDDEA